MKLSIITINYNNRLGLERSLSSVAAQDCRDFEYIVVDGLSGDGSAERIGAFRDRIDRILIEADSGPFEAMNKGAALARGDYLLFLNSGDCLASKDSIAGVLPFLSGEDFYYCDAIFVRGKREWLQRYPDQVDLGYLLLHALNHQNLFLRRDFFSAQGGYDPDYAIISDWGFMVKAFCSGSPTWGHVKLAVAKYHLDGMSSDRDNSQRQLDEKGAYLKKIIPEFGGILADYISLTETEWHKLRVRVRHKRLFDALIKPGLLLGRVLAKLGL